MKFDISIAVDLDHASPIEKADMYSATVCTTENNCGEYKDGDEVSAFVNVKKNHFDLVKMTKVTNDGATYTESWTVWNYSRDTNERNSVCFDANNLDDEMMNISFITGLNFKDIGRIFKALKKMQDEFKFHYTIPDTDLEAN